MQRFCLPGAVVLLALALPSVVQPALAQETTLFARDGFTLRWHLQGGLNAVSESALFWDLAATTAPASGFDPDTQWLESYLKPGLSFEAQLDGGAVLYGGASAVLSHTFGTDAFAAQDSGATTLEEAYLALRGGESRFGFWGDLTGNGAGWIESFAPEAMLRQERRAASRPHRSLAAVQLAGAGQEKSSIQTP